MPLPSFAHLGPAAFQAPPAPPVAAPVGERRRLSAQQSRACRLGQHDYSQRPEHRPNGERVDKRLWRDDPFYGWRREMCQAQAKPLEAPRAAGGGLKQETEAWCRDLFHGWLRDAERGLGGPRHGDLELLQAAAVGRRLLRLPTFLGHGVGDRRGGASPGAASPLRGRAAFAKGWRAEDRWKEDAFFGWLPGRGYGEHHASAVRSLTRLVGDCEPLPMFPLALQATRSPEPSPSPL